MQPASNPTHFTDLIRELEQAGLRSLYLATKRGGIADLIASLSLLGIGIRASDCLWAIVRVRVHSACMLSSRASQSCNCY